MINSINNVSQINNVQNLRKIENTSKVSASTDSISVSAEAKEMAELAADLFGEEQEQIENNRNH